MLQFIGNGSAFNTKLGNTSAYYKEGDQMLLIDCGSSTFSRIKESNLLEGVNHIHVLITHTHADHVGSLADLILYMYYGHGEFAQSKVTVYTVFDFKLDELNLQELLKINGCKLDVHYDLRQMDTYKPNKFPRFTELYAFPFYTLHVEINDFYSFGFIIEISNTTVFYSGDINTIDEEDIEALTENVIDYFYIDTCKADYEGNFHLSLRKLTESIPEAYRHKVWCMHLDEGFDREEAEALGFNVTTNIFD